MYWTSKSSIQLSDYQNKGARVWTTINELPDYWNKYKHFLQWNKIFKT